MKKFFNPFTLIILIAMIGLPMSACRRNEKENGILTITGHIPGPRALVAIYNNPGGFLTRAGIHSTIATGILATSPGLSSPFALQNVVGGTFTLSGTFMIILAFGTEIWTIANVQFTHGSATIRASDLIRFNDLP